MHQFDEHHPEFDGFSRFYDREILPRLQEGEVDRLAAVSKFKQRVPIMVILLGVIIAVLYSRIHVLQLVFFVATMGGVGIAGYAAYLLKDVKSATKSHLVSSICRFVGWDFQVEVVDPPNLIPLIDNGLLPARYDRVSFEDKMTGNAHGADFEALECHMEKERKSDKGPKWVTVFRGSIMVIDFHQEFLGRTVVLRDKGIFNAKKKAGMKRVGLVDPKFEKIFEAYGTDQVEARVLLTPTFMQRLVDLETSVNGQKIRFAFMDGLLVIAVETQNRFEAGSMFKPLADTERTQKILDEIGAVYDIVDGISKPRKFTS